MLRVGRLRTDGLDELELSEEDLDFLRKNLATKTTVYEAELNLRTPGINLARKPRACMMCGREIPFERIQSELVEDRSIGLTICVHCGRCEGREGLHTFQLEIIQIGPTKSGGPPGPKKSGGPPAAATFVAPPSAHTPSKIGLDPLRCRERDSASAHLWIMDRNQQTHGWCATCNHAHVGGVYRRTKGGLDLEGALRALAEKKKTTQAAQGSEAMSIAEPYIKAGLAEPFALAIAAGTPAGEVMDLWESDWWKQYPADDSLIVSVLHGELTEAEARIINEFRGEHRELAEACIEQLVPVAWAQMLLESGFEDHPEAVRHVLEGADPALIARIQNIPVNEPPSPLGLKIVPKGVGPKGPPPPSIGPYTLDKIPDSPKSSNKKSSGIGGILEMLKVMDEFGIVDRDAFLEYAAWCEKNGYIKKGDFMKAAKAWNVSRRS